MFQTQHVIVGGGITGLTLAWQLQRRYGNRLRITVLEKEGHFGGHLQTDLYGDFLFERGPHSCRTYGGGQSVLELIEALGLSEELLHASNAHARYLYLNKKLVAIPRMPLAWLLSPLTRSFLPGLLTEWTVPPYRCTTQNQAEREEETALNKAEETIHAWSTRRLGKGIAERLIDPLMRGIFAGDSRTLSMEACFPGLIAKEHTYGSLTRALFLAPFQKQATSRLYSPWVRSMPPQGLFTLREGWGQLIKRLHMHVQQTATLRTGVRLISLRPSPQSARKKSIELLLEGGERLEADAVYLTTPAHVSAGILRQSASDAATALGRIPFVSVLLAHVGFHQSVLPHQGFGHLVPTWEDPELLGMVWDSSLFPQQNRHPHQTRLTVMLRSGIQTQEKKVQEALSRHLGITKKPDVLEFHLLQEAIPQYTIGHLSRVQRAREALRQNLPQVQLLGNSFDGISLPASISQAREIAWQNNSTQ